MAGDSSQCARSVLETVPAVMRFIRSQMRSRRAADLSVPQFRSLAFIDRKGESSLGEVAEHLGLTPASVSKMVDVLEARRLLSRAHSIRDRRRIVLTLTTDGLKMMKAARAQALEGIASALSALPPHDRSAVARGMRALQSAFALSDRES